MTMTFHAPGWYTDPANASQIRWWDGYRWTEQVGARSFPLGAPMPQTSVTLQRKHTSHLLHLVLTILTGGLWGLLVWLPITIWHKVGPRAKSVTRPG